MSDLSGLGVELIERGLPTTRFGRPLLGYARVDSTNLVARILAEEGASEGTAVVAVEQTEGRGRLGRTWDSPPGGLWMSVVLRPRLPVTAWPLLGFAASLAAADAVETVAGVPVRLKWPNDLVVEDRKLGGVLVEAGGTYAIAGVGINVNVPIEVFPPELRGMATSLETLLGRPVDLVTLAQQVLILLEQHYDVLNENSGALIQRWRLRSCTLGRSVRILGANAVEGVAENVDSHGALLVRTPAGMRRVLAGEVSLREIDAPAG